MQEKIADASINSFSSERTIELPVAEFEAICKDLAEVYNNVVGLLRDGGIMRGRELACLMAEARRGLSAARSPTERILTLNAHLKRLLSALRNGVKKAPRGEIVRIAITKIQLRAQAIVEHVKVLVEGKEKVALNSTQARHFLTGMEGAPVSRRDCIRALRRAERLCPALACGHTPGDGRQTMRLTTTAEDLRDMQTAEEQRDIRQRSV